MQRVSNEELLAELKRIEARIDKYEIQDALNRQILRDDLEKDLNKKMKEYVLDAVFRAEIRPIKAFMAGFTTAGLSMFIGLMLWLVQR